MGKKTRRLYRDYRDLQNDSYTDKPNRKIFAMVTDQPHADLLRWVQTFGCPHSSVRHYNSMMRQLLYIHQAGLKTV